MSPHHAHIRVQGLLAGLNRRAELASSQPVAAEAPVSLPSLATTAMLARAIPRSESPRAEAANNQVLATATR